nr:hypothetical protein Iba_chr06aCG14320 [Ipomoea batatas]GME07970.1 hypothetical protein Iba_scaffold7104CG0060 [Ipomoea batatas]
MMWRLIVQEPKIWTLRTCLSSYQLYSNFYIVLLAVSLKGQLFIIL